MSENSLFNFFLSKDFFKKVFAICRGRNCLIRISFESEKDNCNL